MPVRTFLPMAAVALALGAGSGCTSSTPTATTAQDTGSTQVRPAQMGAMDECDQLAQRVENRMPTAKAYRVPFAQKDLQEARELCRSGQPEEGTAMLRDVLGYMDQEN
jgi:hypothetical protein